MSKSKRIISALILLALAVIGVTTQAQPQLNNVRSSRLSDGELNQLIRRIEAGGDRFRSSLTEAFDRDLYNQTRSEGNMLVAVGDLKNATDQLRNQFDARQPTHEYVERVLGRATPIDRSEEHTSELQSRFEI